MRKLILNILLILNGFSIAGQISSRSKLEVSLIYKIVQQVSWNTKPEGKTFDVGVISQDTSLINAFRQMIEIADFNGKKGMLYVFDQPVLDKKFRLLFVDEKYHKAIPRLWSTGTFQSTLLVTENYSDEKYAMINLEYMETENRFSFQVNKTNLIIGNMSISDKALLMGGSQIDMRDLYLKANENLEKEQSNTQSLKKLIELQKFTIDSNRMVSESLNLSISSLQKLMSATQKKLDYQHHLLDSFGEAVLNRQAQNERQEKIMNERSRIILSQEFRIDSTGKALDRMELKLAESAKTLDEQNSKIRDKDLTIRKQHLRLIGVVSALIVFGLLLLVIIVLLRNRTRLNKELSAKNELLSSQQKQIKEKNDELLAVNEELQSLNEELYSNREELIAQKEKLEVALEELKNSQDRLIQSEKMSSLGMLTAGIAHELKNPLNYISTGVYAMETILSTFSKQLKKWLEDLAVNDDKSAEMPDLSLERTIASVDKVKAGILEGVSRSSNIIESLNIYSYTGESPATRIDLSQCIEKALTILYHQYKNRIEIKRNYAEGIQITASEVKMVQLFTNIFSNAIDAIEGKGYIEISTGKKDKMVQVDVKDTGKGIDPSQLPQVFDPFFTTKEAGKGTGLGLSIVYNIVKQHGGDVKVESVPGSYTIFHFTFPAAS